MKKIKIDKQKVFKRIALLIVVAAIAASAIFAYNKQMAANRAEEELTAFKVQDALERNGQKATDITVKDRNKRNVKISDKKGKPVVICFWARWSGESLNEIEILEKVFKERKSDASFMMINITDDNLNSVKNATDFWAREKYEMPVFFDTKNEAIKAYNITDLPVLVFLYSDGTIYDIRQGDEETGYVSKEDINECIDNICDTEN